MLSRIIRAALNQVEIKDHAWLAKNSVKNHHVNGLDYLCLHRSEHLTLKVYLIPEVQNDNSGFLVHPHNHRYSFDSVVLSGRLEHYRFVEKSVGRWHRLGFDHKTKKTETQKVHIGLDRVAVEDHTAGSHYYTEAHEIHTLKILEPTLIGLAQYEDKNFDSYLYVPERLHGIIFSNARQMSEKEYAHTLSMVKKELNASDNDSHRGGAE